MPKTIFDQAEVTQIGGRIKGLREKLEMSTRDFCEGIPGLHSANLSEIERGRRRPTYPMLAGIAKKYAVTTDYLLFGNQTSLTKNVVSGLRICPVMSEASVSEYLASLDETALASPPITERTYAATTTDSRAFYIQASTPATTGLRDLSVIPGDLLLVEPGRRPSTGGYGVTLHLEKVQLCRVVPIDDGVGLMTASGKILSYSAREFSTLRLCRAGAIIRLL